MADYQKIGFVILHYNAIKETMDCVTSIKNHIDTNHYHIVVVDNGSPNGSGKDLAEAYEKDDLVTVILAKENLGFARGNNLGFVYAVNEEDCNFLCVMNNDTLVVQNDFFATILEEYHKSGFGVMGPKILLNDGKVQPLTHKMPGITFFENEIRIHKREKNLRKKHLYSFYLFGRKVKSFFLLVSGHRRVSRFKPYLKLDGLDERRENVVLHGCCLVFSPKYIQSYEDGFFPDTFLYKEEELLYLRCRRKHLLTVYNPKLKIRHLEDVATDSITSRKKEKQMLWLNHQIRSLEILVGELRKERD